VTARPSEPAPRVVGVRRLADYLKRKLENDANLKSVAVKGEITNFSVPRSGHANFDLKEGDAILKCFAWASDAAEFPPLRNGLAVIATGNVSTYSLKSTYQLVVKRVELDGIGDVYALFEARKRALAAEGLFDASRKRPLPRFPFRVALVSSRGANGAIDFVKLLRARAPHVAIEWCETSVQGPNAPAEIVAALRRASQADVDLIVVTRGGGAFEDLFWFSDENVVRAVARARHPLISAIGHAADQQLCDFAADVHVETPSAAAKAVGPETRELLAFLADRAERARRTAVALVEALGARYVTAVVRSRLAEPRLIFAPLAQRLDEANRDLERAAADARNARDARLRALVRRLDARDPTRRLAERGLRLQRAASALDGAFAAGVVRARRALEASERRLDGAGRETLRGRFQRLALADAKLDGKNPEAILQRGYAIVTVGGAVVTDAAAVASGTPIEARLARGTLRARVERDDTDGNERIG
jgi:exodeoxyribonuclease VII large subunit